MANKDRHRRKEKRKTPARPQAAPAAESTQEREARMAKARALRGDRRPREG